MGVNTSVTRAPGPVPGRGRWASPAPTRRKPTPHQNFLPRTLRAPLECRSCVTGVVTGGHHRATGSLSAAYDGSCRRAAVDQRHLGQGGPPGTTHPPTQASPEPRGMQPVGPPGWGSGRSSQGSCRGQLTFLWPADDLRGVCTHAGKQVQSCRAQAQTPRAQPQRRPPTQS